MERVKGKAAAAILVASFLVAASFTALANGSPDIAVEGMSGPIANGGSEDQGARDPGQSTIFTLSITNTGTSELSGGPITVMNEDNVDVNALGPIMFTFPPGSGDELRVSIAYTPLSFAAFSFQVSILNNDPDESPYVFTVTGIGETTVPEIEIEGASGSIADEDTVNEGVKPAGVGQVFSFSIRNTGSRTLNGSFNGATNPINVTLGPFVTVDFILPRGDDVIMFGVGYTPSTSCPFSFDLEITSDDADENPYNIRVQGSDDTEAPEITCPPDAAVECGDSTAPAQTGQATATDNCTPEQDIAISWSDAVDPSPCCGSGSIVRTWMATDLWGNSSSCDQMIAIVDTTPPGITLLGPDPLILELGTPYSEWGAQVQDVCCVSSGDLRIDASDLDESTPGTYIVSYDVDDCTGNPATTVMRTLEIVDTTAPLIDIRTPANDAEYLLREIVLADWTVTDLASDVLISASVQVGEPIDTDRPGRHTFTVSAIDGSGNEATATAEYAVRYRVQLEPETLAFEFADSDGGQVPAPALPAEPVVLSSEDPIRVEFRLFDSFGQPLTDAVPTLSVVKVTPGTDPEVRQILWLQVIEFDEETSSYACVVSIETDALPGPGLYDFYIGLGDARNLYQRILVE